MSIVPNLLTLLRLILAPIVAWALWNAASPPGLGEDADLAAYLDASDGWAILAAGLFTFAAFTDLLDGWAARALDADSKLGRLLDPIADKALVGLPLIVLAIIAWRNDSPQAMMLVLGVSTLVIVGRDILITVLRMTASDGEGARVTSLAKWKTTAELLAVGRPRPRRADGLGIFHRPVDDVVVDDPAGPGRDPVGSHRHPVPDWTICAF